MAISLSYSIPYIFAFLFIFTITARDIQWISHGNSSNIKVRIILISFYLFFIGCRGFLHTDWVVYYPEFQKLPVLWNLGNYQFSDMVWEPGFSLYSIIIKSFFPSYYAWVFIGTLIDILIIDYLLKNNLKYYALGFIFFYSFFTMYEINLLRNSKAIMLFFLSLQYVERNSYGRYLLINLIGLTFHTSALIYLCIYPILKIHFNRTFLISFFLVGVTVFILQIQWCSGILSFIGENLKIGRMWLLLRYIEHSESSILSIGFIERTFTFIFLFWNRNKIENHSRFGHIIYNCYLLYFFFYFYFSEFGVFSDRFSTLFILSYCFVYPIAFQYTKKNKLIFIFIMFIYMFLKELIGNRDILNKYSNIFFGVESYEERMKDAFKSKPYLQDRYYYQLYN